ncbi:hypothetical protein [Crateriforma conspicua]|uniref:Uncharacterized protein n=1 Tax=Crateriforma conspicua TaxID=2527996 RepID=A0A5C5Y661_9PLAN|nr:hypothetical protein [Crateriforma conspicua]TWT69725.1 hypothetical protein Pan14r_20170 [Crateriforma conspicua]
MDILDSDIPDFIRRRRPVRDSLVFVLSHVYSIVLLTGLWFAFALRVGSSGGYIRYMRLRWVDPAWLWLVDYDIDPPFWVQWANIRYIDAIYFVCELHYPIED